MVDISVGYDEGMNSSEAQLLAALQESAQKTEKESADALREIASGLDDLLGEEMIGQDSDVTDLIGGGEEIQ